jgi:hypothetical protein
MTLSLAQNHEDLASPAAGSRQRSFVDRAMKIEHAEIQAGAVQPNREGPRQSLVSTGATTSAVLRLDPCSAGRLTAIGALGGLIKGDIAILRVADAKNSTSGAFRPEVSPCTETVIVRPG